MTTRNTSINTPANKTVVSGYKSAIGSLLSVESIGYNLSRTVEGNKDDTMSFDLFAVDIISCFWRATLRSYAKNTRKGKTMNATAETAKMIPLFVSNPEGYHGDAVRQTRKQPS